MAREHINMKLLLVAVSVLTIVTASPVEVHAETTAPALFEFELPPGYEWLEKKIISLLTGVSEDIPTLTESQRLELKSIMSSDQFDQLSAILDQPLGTTTTFMPLKMDWTTKDFSSSSWWSAGWVTDWWTSTVSWKDEYEYDDDDYVVERPWSDVTEQPVPDDDGLDFESNSTNSNSTTGRSNLMRKISKCLAPKSRHWLVLIIVAGVAFLLVLVVATICCIQKCRAGYKVKEHGSVPYNSLKDEEKKTPLV